MPEAPKPEAIRRFANDAGLLQADDTCDHDTLTARAEFWRLVDNGRKIPPPPDDQKFEAALRQANILQQISCNPTNGLAWADLASAEFKAAGWNDRVSGFLSQSQEKAPYEGEALRLRLSVLGSATIDDSASVELLRRDVSTSLRYASPYDAAMMLQGLDAAQRSWANEYLLSLPTDRRDSIIASLKSLPPVQAN